MKRKLIKQAKQALTLTLPIEWSRENGLKPGDEIDLEMVGKDLLLRSGKKIMTGSLSLKTTGFQPRLKFVFMNAAYARGIDQIELESDSNYYPDLVENIGFAVLSQKNNKFIIRDISGVSQENLDDLFKRVFQMIINFYEQALEDIFSSNKATLNTINNIDREINKYVLFLERAIMKHSHPDPDLGRIIFAYSFNLEKIGDEILRLWRTNIQITKIPKSKPLQDLFLLLKNGLQKSFAIYYQSDPERIKEILDIRLKIREASLPFLSNPKTAQLIIHIIRIIEDCYDLTHLALMKRFKPQ